MNRHSNGQLAWLLLLGALFTTTATAQEEAPAEVEGSRIGNFFVNVESWVAQPTGLQYVSATETDPTDPLQTQLLELDHSTENNARYQLEWQLPSDFGTVRFTTYSHDDDEAMQMFDPSNFIFGEVLNHPLLAGVNNDGLADGFASRARTKLDDDRIDFSRQAFRSPKVVANWFVGWRRVEHSRRHSAEYFALVPGFPPLLPPAGFCDVPCQLIPRPDLASVRSSYEGRGATVGIELEFPLWKNRVVLESDLSVTLMRGDTSTEYTSENHAYILDIGQGDFILLGPPYDEFDDVFIDEGGNIIPILSDISQVDLALGLQSDVSTDSQVYDASIGVRWRTPYKRLEVFAGIRQTHYENVGIDLRPKNVTISVTEEGQIVRNIQDIDQIDRSVTYEGLFGGLRFRLY